MDKEIEKPKRYKKKFENNTAIVLGAQKLGSKELPNKSKEVKPIITMSQKELKRKATDEAKSKLNKEVK